ncbi:hypothetical protein ACL1C9_13410, partial [Corynebacterium striatum]
QHQRIVVPPTSTMKENPLQYRVRGTPVPTTRTRGTNYPKSTPYRQTSREQARSGSNHIASMNHTTYMNYTNYRDSTAKRYRENEE